MCLKDQIINLRSQGLTYNQISIQLQCSKSTVCYYCGTDQKNKFRDRQRKRRSTEHPFVKKLDNFCLSNNPKTRLPNDGLSIRILILSKINWFHREHKNMKKYNTPSFTVDDVINKFGNSFQCYLTGDLIDITQPRTYSFDHIIPRSRGGTNNIDNLGVCTKQVNTAKNNMTPDEFINLCKKVLEHNGYTITKS